MGISNWLARGGKMSGPPEVLKALEKAVEEDIEQTGIRIIREVLPYALLFDRISIVTGVPFSAPFLRDLETSLGIIIVNPESISSEAPSKEEVEQHLAAITRRTDGGILMKALYKMAGSFAADIPDLIPIIYSMMLSFRLSKKLSATLNCSETDLEIHKAVGGGLIQPRTDERLDVMQRIFRIHELPVLTVDAFRDSQHRINLDGLFTSMKTLRQSQHIKRFREKLADFLRSQDDIDQIIFKDILKDLRSAVEENVVSPTEIGKRILENE